MKVIWSFIKKLVVSSIIILIGIIAWAAIQPLLVLNRIKPGMTRAQVIDEVGMPPKFDRTDFPECTGTGQHWTGDCEVLKSSGAATFATWKFGIDTLLVVGFDTKGKVVFRGVGDT